MTAHKLKTRAMRLREELIEAGVAKDELQEIFQIIRPETT